MAQSRKKLFYIGKSCKKMRQKVTRRNRFKRKIFPREGHDTHMIKGEK